jgi:hypothetical protein
MSSNAVDMAGFVVTETDADPAVRAEVLWLADTMRRAHLRLGRALAALGELPGLLATASQLQTPDAAYDDAEAIATAVRRAVEELEAIEDYAWAVTDPGEASCRACGARLGCFLGHDGLRHWRPVADPAALSGHRKELFEATHEPDPVWARTDRPDWAARAGEQALNIPDDGERRSADQ